jgi:ABC-type antimicrobial peptide transport system permease subunit
MSPQLAEQTRGESASEVAGGLWSDVWKRFRRNPIALAGFYVVCFLALVALLADFVANDKPYYVQ